jgi:hypothetical protein
MKERSSMQRFERRTGGFEFKQGAKRVSLCCAILLGLIQAIFAADDHASARTLTLTRGEYRDRVNAVWHAQIIAVIATWPFEHKVASVTPVHDIPKEYQTAPIDDDWYYEMCAVRGFEKFGIRMTAEQLGQQWLENRCGSWGSSEQARLNLENGIKAPDCGHPRFNKLWFTLGPQFSSDLYGALAPGMPNVAGRMAREYGHVNGYAEAVDGAVFTATMISLGFTETDPKTIVRNAVTILHPSSPYRQCVEQVIAMAEAGKSFEEIVAAIEDRWHIEYPGTNNAVSNGGLVAASLWFGEGDFWKTVNLSARAGDFTDADCNAANAVSVIGAMHGMKALPAEIVAQFHDRLVGKGMGSVKEFTPPVDESISALAGRTVVIGEKILLSEGATNNNETLNIPVQKPAAQAAERFTLADLMQYWNSDWVLERAGFGGAGGGMAGIRGITHLEGAVLGTYPRDEVRGCLLRRKLYLGRTPQLTFEVGSDSGRAWELEVYAENKLLEKRIIDGPDAPGRAWQKVSLDLKEYSQNEVTLRLYQRVLLPNRTAGNAYGKNIVVSSF